MAFLAVGNLAIGRSPLLLLALLSSCRAALDVSPALLPDGTVGKPYEARIVVKNNHTPLGGAGVESGSLPPGLMLGRVEQDNGLPIRGTPTRADKHAFRLHLWCYGTNFPGQTAARDYVIVIR